MNRPAILLTALTLAGVVAVWSWPRAGGSIPSQPSPAACARPGCHPLDPQAMPGSASSPVAPRRTNRSKQPAQSTDPRPGLAQLPHTTHQDGGRSQAEPESDSLPRYSGTAATRPLIAPHSPAAHAAPDLSDSSYVSPQPAVWVDLGDLLAADPHVDATLQAEAERLLEVIVSADKVSADPQQAAQLRHEAIATSDQLFRARFGGWVWMQHHLQSHHLAAARTRTVP